MDIQYHYVINGIFVLCCWQIRGEIDVDPFYGPTGVANYLLDRTDGIHAFPVSVVLVAAIVA